MKKLNYFIKFACIAMVAGIALTSCNKEDDAPTTVEEDKDNIQASFDRVKNLLQHTKDGATFRFLEDFTNLHQEEIVENPGWGYSYTYTDWVVSDFAELLGDEFMDAYGDSYLDQIEDEYRFSYASYKGKYEWNGSRWTKNTNATIQVLFPSTKGGSNNCDAGITAYEDTKVTIEGDEIYLPTKVSAYFKKDGTLLASAEATASFNTNGIPQSVKAQAYAALLKVSAEGAQISSSKFTATASVQDETTAENNLGASVEVTLSNVINTYSDFDDVHINYIKFTITQAALTLSGTVDLKTLNGSEKTEDINQCCHVEVLYNGKPTGTLTVREVNDEQQLFIAYKDGTEENTSIYYDPFIDDLEAMFDKYIAR